MVKGFQRGKCSQPEGFGNVSWPLRGRSRGRACTRGPSCSRVGIQKVPTWADRAKPQPVVPPPEVTQVPLPEHREENGVPQLIQENACLKTDIQQLRDDLESFRKPHSS
ncbi:hypothetical protein HPB52_025364 [Rhipicephalus sanguineus]|uniref:Uncharacterized protein n=1 Tax=Rhipicephalus sanguineus TaxID=34632 RepID=A0A9D4TD33_RHISA|nr:hypothetical protein HPB52_010741 [Rhipicephalus sanguineus]KAH7985841.1 hypothetical protein HPB52_025364 [Rhipicephalus sanguineus]